MEELSEGDLLRRSQMQDDAENYCSVPNWQTLDLTKEKNWLAVYKSYRANVRLLSEERPGPALRSTRLFARENALAMRQALHDSAANHRKPIQNMLNEE